MRGGAYVPQAGTIPYKVMAYLQEQAALGRHWVPAAELSEHIGQKAVSPYLEAPIRYGVFVRRAMKDNGRNSEYALGNGKPLPVATDHEPDEPLHAAVSAPPRPGPLFPEAVGQAPSPAKAKRGRPTRDDARAAFHAGLFLDGSMQLEVNGVQVALIAEQVAQLARLLRGVPA